MTGQLDLYGGQQAQLAAMVRLAHGHQEFLATVRAWARHYIAVRGSVSMDDLRAEAKAKGLKPRHPNVWGAVFKEAGWKVVGRRQSSVVSNHAREIRVWRWVEPPC